MLSGPAGALAAGIPDTIFVVVSTITTACVETIGAEAAALGVPVVDCGVSGGPSAAASGNLVCMCGGDPDVIAGLAPVFDAPGSAHRHGPVRQRVGGQAWPATWCSTEGGWRPTRGQVLGRRPPASVILAKLAQVVRWASDAQRPAAPRR